MAIVVLAAMAGASCNDSPSDPSGTAANPTGTAAPENPAPMDSAAVDSAAVDSAASGVTYTGLPYGVFGLWASPTTFEWGPAPFTLSHDNTFANSILTRLSTARLNKQRMVLAMTGGPASDYKTGNKFDLSKWKNRMNTFKTPTIQSAVAAGVADGTIIGNTLMNEPETPQWGGVMTKPLLDQMAAYVKSIFPTLPVGVNYGARGYTWRPGEVYQKVDYALNQYAWQNNGGNIAAWRDAVLGRMKIDGVKAAFSLNLLDGGVPDNDGTWDCTGTGGKGTRYGKCRMTPDQVKNYGQTAGPSGCFMLGWEYDDAFMSKSANVDAFKSVASLLATLTPKSCRRG